MEHNFEELAKEAVHQRDQLAQGILKTAVQIGLIKPGTELLGPELLLFCDDFTQIIVDQTEKINQLEAKLAALLPQGDTGE